MAHFLKPPANSSDGYDLDNKGALWRLRVPLSKSSDVTLWGGGGSGEKLLVTLNDPSVVTVSEAGISGPDLRLFRLYPKKAGNAMIEAKTSNGAVWAFIQVVVEEAMAASQVGRVAFASMDQCGIAALDEILSRSISEGVEFAGLIFKQGARFGFTAPLRGEPDSAFPGLTVPAGTTTVGTYHTHGDKQGGAAEGFSIQDRGFHNLKHWFAYLGTPSRAIWKLTPKERLPDENPWLAGFAGNAERLR